MNQVAGVQFALPDAGILQLGSDLARALHAHHVAGGGFDQHAAASDRIPEFGSALGKRDRVCCSISPDGAFQRLSNSGTDRRLLASNC